MSRRDTIIIAVLVNAALLMILFATAIRSGDSKEDGKKNKSNVADLADATPNLAPAPLQDALLNELVTSVPTLAESGAAQGEILFPFEEGIEIASATPQPLPLTPPTPSGAIIDPFPSTPIVVAPPPAPVKPEAQFVNVTVKKGDFLEKIAKANNTTVAAIMKSNNLSSTQLKIGQVLKVPLTKGEKKGDSTPASSGSQAQGNEYYVVKEGDNPWLIASRNKINLEELLRLNGLDDQKAKKLRPGDKLKIR